MFAPKGKILTIGDDRLVEIGMIIKDNYHMLLVISPKIVTNQEHHQGFSVFDKFSNLADDVLAGKVISTNEFD